jgi:hypothetical protein
MREDFHFRGIPRAIPQHMFILPGTARRKGHFCQDIRVPGLREVVVQGPTP